MTTITAPDYAKNLGVPVQEHIDIGVTPEGLFAASEPPILREECTAANNLNLPAYTVVGFDSNGHIAQAVLGTIPAIGIILNDLITPTSGANVGVSVVRGGCLKMALLNYHSSYDTDEKKKEAFRGAPTPTQIVIRTPSAYNPVTP